MTTNTFTACYEGGCAGCFGWICPGDDVAFVDDELVCVDCAILAEDDK